MTKIEMHPLRRMLVPTDFSKAAGQAVEYAAYLAGKINATIILFHSVRIPVVSQNENIEIISTKELERDCLNQLNFIRDDLKSRFPKTEIEVEVKSGFAVEEINSVSETEQADLIVMGTKGAGKLKELLIGSNTAGVLEKASHPVLVVPSEAQFSGFKNAVFATNYQDNDFQTIFLLSQMLKPFNAKINVLHVEDAGKHSHVENRTQDWFKKQVLSNIPYDRFSFDEIGGKNVAEALNDYAVTNAIDLVVLSMRKRNFFQRLFEKSLSKEMAYHSKIPFLVFHALDTKDSDGHSHG